MHGARSGGSLRRTGAAARRCVMMIQPKSELALKRLSSIKIAGHGTGNAVVLEAEAVSIIRVGLEAVD